MTLSNLIKRLKREAFLTTRLGIVTNPAYFARRGLYQHILALAPSFEGDILDFGCGSKPYMSLFTNAQNYIGLDIATSGHDHRNSQIDVLYDGKTIPFDNSSFDGIVCFEVLEHVFNLDDVLSEMIRVIKPGGRLLITLPFAWFEHEQPYDFARYTSFGISSLLQRQGLTLVSLQKTTTAIEAICQLFIEFIANVTRSKSVIWRMLSQIVLIFPLTAIASLICTIAPKRDNLYCNLVIVAQKPATP